MYSAMDDAALPAPGFPIRRSAGQRLFSASPRLIAAVHVLLRLLVPRHPPCALNILTVSTAPRANALGRREYPFGLCAVFKLHRDCARGRRTRSLETEQRYGARGAAMGPVDVSGRPPGVAPGGRTPSAVPLTRA